jgi:Protein of unknown function (DUF2933)
VTGIRPELSNGDEPRACCRLAGVFLLYIALGLWAVLPGLPLRPSHQTPIRPRPARGRHQDMNTNMQGHNRGGKGHLLWMLGIGALVLVVLLGTGRSFQQALPFAVFLACPLMMVGMMFMMRGGNGHQHDNDATDHRDHDAVAEWQDSAGTPSHPRKATTTLH